MMRQFSYIVLIERPEAQHRGPVVVGPFRTKRTAEQKAEKVQRALDRAGVEATASAGYIENGARSLSSIVEEVR